MERRGIGALAKKKETVDSGDSGDGGDDDDDDCRHHIFFQKYVIRKKS